MNSEKFVELLGSEVEGVLSKGKMKNMRYVLFIVAIASIIATGIASADEPWACAMNGSIRRYQVVGNELRDLSSARLLQSFGVKDGGLTYKILEDTPFGIVAATTQASRPGARGVSVWTSIILLNKQTGAFRSMSFSTEAGGRDESEKGQCE